MVAIWSRYQECGHRWSFFPCFWETRRTSRRYHQISLSRHEYNPLPRSWPHRTSRARECSCTQWESEATLSSNSKSILWRFESTWFKVPFVFDPEWRNYNQVQNEIGHASCPKPLFQSEAKCESIDMKNIFYSHANKLIFTRKVFYLASFWKWEFLELGNGLIGFSVYLVVKWNMHKNRRKICKHLMFNHT